MTLQRQMCKGKQLAGGENIPVWILLKLDQKITMAPLASLCVCLHK